MSKGLNKMDCFAVLITVFVKLEVNTIFFFFLLFYFYAFCMKTILSIM
jgi:hypothetical protein